LTFSQRTSWHREQNRLTQALEARRSQGLPVIDLTVTNPTECGFSYSGIQTALVNPQALQYHPDPHGLLSAREAITAYYKERAVDVHPSDIILTASTSEGYSFIFKLLCNAGETVLVPAPSYPLFEYLAQVNDVELIQYQLLYDHGWHIDVDSIKRGLTAGTKAIVIVSPHNPTGMVLHQNEYRALIEIAQRNHLALIVDEVFVDYCFNAAHAPPCTAEKSDVLTFTLNGLSKMCGLPQMKLGWIITSGNPVEASEALERLEILSDTFLSVNTPVQVALPEFFKAGRAIRQQIRNRTANNYFWLKNRITSQSHLTLLDTEGGWSTVLRVPSIHTDEEWALNLLEQEGILVYPGYFFDFEREGYLVVSLLVEETHFQSAMDRVIAYIDTHS